ncbi:MAG: hypothetical protein ABJP34_02125 [Erythrobacter sp.]
MRNPLYISVVAAAIVTVSFAPAPLRAQNESIVTPEAEKEQPANPDVIDILVRPETGRVDPLAEERCRRDQEAASISGEIVVCGRSVDNSKYRTTSDSQKRYAEETAFINDPQAPDVAGAGIFRGPATVGGMCFIPPCPPPKALIIDVEALPEAPPGSDADRIGRGLPPVGQDEAAIPPIEVIRNDLPRSNIGPQIDYVSPALGETAEIGTGTTNPDEAG